MIALKVLPLTPAMVVAGSVSLLGTTASALGVLQKNVTYEAAFSLTHAAKFGVDGVTYIYASIYPALASSAEANGLIELFDSAGTLVGQKTDIFSNLVAYWPVDISTPDNSGTIRVTTSDNDIELSKLEIVYGISGSASSLEYFTNIVNVLPDLQPAAAVPLPATLPLLAAPFGLIFGLRRWQTAARA